MGSIYLFPSSLGKEGTICFVPLSSGISIAIEMATFHLSTIQFPAMAFQSADL